MDCSDKPRRTMSEALRTGRLNEDALAFVNGAAAKPAASQAPVSASETRVEHSQTDVRPAVAGTVSMSFRLPAPLSARLVKASVERKLRRERPFSQQDIVAEALDEWLKHHDAST
jgi:hypothetical protein